MERTPTAELELHAVTILEDRNDDRQDMSSSATPPKPHRLRRTSSHETRSVEGLPTSK